MKLLCLFGLILCTWPTNAARILGIVPIKAKSHFYFNEAIFKSLVSAGHHVTLISPFSAQKSVQNFTILDPSQKKANDNPFAAVAIKNIDVLTMVRVTIDVTAEDCEDVLQMPFIQNLANSHEKQFDVLFVEAFLMNECYLPLGEKLGIPVIGTTSLASFHLSDSAIGNPRWAAVDPNETVFLKRHMTFFERLKNVFYYTLDLYSNKFVLEPKVKNIRAKYYENKSTDKKISLLFANNHPSVFPRVGVPSVVNIGGIHLETSTAQQLPGDIQKFLDEAKHGAILFSLGSIITSKTLPPEIKTVLKETFAVIPQRVIWKFDEDIPGLSDNVLISKWVPQKEILGHPNVVAFMSHCGLLSTYEAIFYAKPMIIIPIFADQPSTAARLEELGVGVLLDIMDANTEELIMLLDEIVNKTKYQSNMRKLSQTLKDNQNSASQSVVYWTDYVLRYNGTQHLRTAGADMPFYQYLLLDVIAFATSAIICLVYSLIYLSKTLRIFFIRFVKMKSLNEGKKKS